MFIVVRVYFMLIILNILKENDALVELPHVEDNDILNTESIIRTTINTLFSSLKLKGPRENPILKQYGLIHNYFVSLTLKDYSNLKEIARLTRVDKKSIDEKDIKFIDLINEILNGDIDGAISSYNEIGNYIDKLSQNVAYLKQTYGDNIPRTEINKEVIKILENDYVYKNKTQNNHTHTKHNNDLLAKNHFWVPDLGFRRIYQGKRTKIKWFPFMACVQLFNNFQCGGSVIGDDLIITAASCLQLVWNNRIFRENPSFLSVKIGSNYYEGGGETIAVLEVYFYPTYDPHFLKNNLAIMKLVRKINFAKTKKRVKKIDIDRSESALPVNDRVTIVGWGAQTKQNIIGNPWENTISFAILDMYSLQECQEVYTKDYVTRTNFCAGKITEGVGACNKDVGGPGIVNGILTGVVSFGSPTCGTPDAPTVFTKVGYYADWIEQIMEHELIEPTAKVKRTTIAKPNTTLYKATTQKPSQTPIYSQTAYTFTAPPPTTTVTYSVYIPPLTKPKKSYEVEPLTTPESGGNSTITTNTTNTTNSTNLTNSTIPKPASGNGTDLFKQFLKTVFNDKEIEQYIDVSKVFSKDELVDSPKLIDKNDHISMVNDDETESKSKEKDSDDSKEKLRFTQLAPPDPPTEKGWDSPEKVTETEKDVIPARTAGSHEQVTVIDESLMYIPDKTKKKKKHKKTTKSISNENSKFLSVSEENDYAPIKSTTEEEVNEIDETEAGDVVKLLDKIDHKQKKHWQKDGIEWIGESSSEKFVPEKLEAKKDFDQEFLPMVDKIDLEKKIQSLWQQNSDEDTEMSESEYKQGVNEDKKDVYYEGKNEPFVDQTRTGKSGQNTNEHQKPSSKEKNASNDGKKSSSKTNLWTLFYYSDSEKKNNLRTSIINNNKTIFDYLDDENAKGEKKVDDNIELNKKEEEIVKALEQSLGETGNDILNKNDNEIIKALEKSLDETGNTLLNKTDEEIIDSLLEKTLGITNSATQQSSVSTSTKKPFIIDLTQKRTQNESVFRDELSALFDVLTDVLDIAQNETNIT